jgi:hypothetical protein
MATELRWSFDQIDDSSWPYVVSLLNFWNKTPPTSQLLNHYARYKGMKLIAKGEQTDFEKAMLDKSRVLDLSQVPVHLRGLIQEVQEGKHVRRRD